MAALVAKLRVAKKVAGQIMTARYECPFYMFFNVCHNCVHKLHIFIICLTNWCTRDVVLHCTFVLSNIMMQRSANKQYFVIFIHVFCCILHMTFLVSNGQVKIISIPNI